MSLIGKEIVEFKAHAYHKGEFIEVSSEDLKGKWSIVCFYPADFTFVCPTELEDLQDQYSTLQGLGVEVYSVSTDTHFTHKAWHDHSPAIGKIEYTMIGDPSHAISIGFDVLDEEGLAQRGTFIIDPNGNLRWYLVNDLGIGRNIDEVLRVLSALQTGELCQANWKPGEKTLGK